jgi:hypothetical protein
MADKPKRRKGAAPEGPRSVKVTLILDVDTARRLGVEAEMRLTTKSKVAGEILARALSRWRLPSLAGPGSEDGQGRGDVA